MAPHARIPNNGKLGNKLEILTERKKSSLINANAKIKIKTPMGFT